MTDIITTFLLNESAGAPSWYWVLVLCVQIISEILSYQKKGFFDYTSIAKNLACLALLSCGVVISFQVINNMQLFTPVENFMSILGLGIVWTVLINTCWSTQTFGTPLAFLGDSNNKKSELNESSSGATISPWQTQDKSE